MTQMDDSIGEAYIEGRRDEKDRIGRELEPTIRFLTAIVNRPDLDYELAREAADLLGRLRALRGDR